MTNKIFALLLLISGCGKNPNDETRLYMNNITGIDNRTPVKDTTAYPYNLVGKVSGFGPGSGAFVAPNLVLTAAHVAREYATSFYPGYNNSKKVLGSFRVILRAFGFLGQGSEELLSF